MTDSDRQPIRPMKVRLFRHLIAGSYHPDYGTLDDPREPDDDEAIES